MAEQELGEGCMGTSEAEESEYLLGCILTRIIHFPVRRLRAVFAAVERIEALQKNQSLPRTIAMPYKRHGT
jgi:hypothetical protein